MNNFERLRDRFLNKTATQEERNELLLNYRQEFIDYLYELEKKKVEANSEEIFRKKSFDEIIAEYPELTPEEFEDAIPIHRSSFGLWLKVAAAIVTLSIGITLYQYSLKRTQADQSAFNQTIEGKQQIFTGADFIKLPDGSKVTLNEGSELSYDQAFGVKSRIVILTGEATFDVKHDPSKPFTVQTGKVSTKVLGTEFNVKADQHQIIVTVLRGLVEVGDEQRVYGKISPNEQIAVNIPSYDFVRQKTKAEEVVQWQKHFLILDDVDLEEAAAIVGKKFRVKIILEKPDMKKCRIDGTFLNDESLAEVLSLIGKAINVTYTIEKGGNVVLRGGEEC